MPKSKQQTHTNLECGVLLGEVGRAVSSVRLTSFGSLLITVEAEYVGYDISRSYLDISCNHLEGNLHVRLGFCIWVILGSFAETLQRISKRPNTGWTRLHLMNDEFLRLDFAVAYVLPRLCQVFVDVTDYNLCRFSRKDLVEDESAQTVKRIHKRLGCHSLRYFLRHSRVFSSLHVETFDLDRGFARVFDLQCCILLLLKKKQSLEDAVQIDFQKFVTVIDSFLKIGRNFEGVCEVRGIRVHEDGVCITINNLGG